MDFLMIILKEHFIMFLVLSIILTIILFIHIKHNLNIKNDSCKSINNNYNKTYSRNYVERDKNVKSKSSNDEIISLIEKYYKEGEKK